MKTNLLIAISNLVQNPITNLISHYGGVNRANSMGGALEVYIKDLFCNSLNESSEDKKNRIYNDNFSYLGNKNNPPDIMIKQGDAIEVKKIESLAGGIQLNSSYPKNKLFSNDTRITNECRDCEDWKEKDLLYVIGSAKSQKLKALWFVYGDCYAASKETYEKMSDKISKGLHNLQDIEFSETNEIGKVKSVDPLGITTLRIRGMWGIEHPIKVFDYLPIVKDSSFFANVVLLNEKYSSFPTEDRERLESLVSDKFCIKDVKIKSPNNPAKLLDAKLLTFRG